MGKRGRPRKHGKTLTEKGYVRFTLGPHKWRYEHHVILEAKLGRPIKLDHECHHDNGMPWDNTPDNLIEMPSLDHRKHSGKNGKGRNGNGNGNGSAGRRGPWNMTQSEYQEFILQRGVGVPPSVMKLMSVAPF